MLHRLLLDLYFWVIYYEVVDVVIVNNVRHRFFIIHFLVNPSILGFRHLWHLMGSRKRLWRELLVWLELLWRAIALVCIEVSIDSLERLLKFHLRSVVLRIVLMLGWLKASL